MTVGQLIMLGTLIGLIVLVFGVVIAFDPEARADPGGARGGEERTADDGRIR